MKVGSSLPHACDSFTREIIDPRSLDGYPRLGRLMSASPALAIFRRFGTLNAQNLLYLQAEINELERELQEIAIEDRSSADAETQCYSREWWKLAGAKGRNSLQWKKCLEIRTKLAEYSTMLLTSDETKSMSDVRL